jgi:hypothetical protein
MRRDFTSDLKSVSKKGVGEEAKAGERLNANEDLDLGDSGDEDQRDFMRNNLATIDETNLKNEYSNYTSS